jgi:hypothetical protein
MEKIVEGQARRLQELEMTHKRWGQGEVGRPWCGS